MTGYRPRRALRAPFAVRVARITVPALVVGALAAGVTVTAWPTADPLTAVPAASAAPAEVGRELPDRASRNEKRPSMAPSPSAASDAKSDKRESAKEPAKKSAKNPDQAKSDENADDSTAVESGSSARSATPAPKPEPALDLTVVGSRYTTAELNVRTTPEEDSKVLTVVERRGKVAITDTVEDGFRLIVRSGKGRWVKDEYLAKKKPPAEPEISSASCDKSSSIEGGLQPDGVRVYRALCARFPNISSFGGRRPANGGFHPSGRAVDAMIDTNNGGWEVARWVRANASRLGVSEVIHAQSIWTTQRSGEGWRGMSDMGNKTANHFDHVHISVHGNSGSS